MVTRVMALPHLTTTFTTSADGRHLELLVDELTEALEETVRMATGPTTHLEWDVHLDYLRAMQRVARESLAASTTG